MIAFLKEIRFGGGAENQSVRRWRGLWLRGCVLLALFVLGEVHLHAANSTTGVFAIANSSFIGVRVFLNAATNGVAANQTVFVPPGSIYTFSTAMQGTGKAFPALTIDTQDRVNNGVNQGTQGLGGNIQIGVTAATAATTVYWVVHIESWDNTNANSFDIWPYETLSVLPTGWAACGQSGPGWPNVIQYFVYGFVTGGLVYSVGIMRRLLVKLGTWGAGHSDAGV